MDKAQFRTLCILFLLILASAFAEAFFTIEKPHGYVHEKDFQRYKPKQDGECKSDQLTCVPQDDCELECPYGFAKLKNGGSCYFISNDQYNKKRTLHEAEDYCSVINSRLFWIEDSKELLDLILLFNQTTNTSMSTDSMGEEETVTLEPQTDVDEDDTNEQMPTSVEHTELFFIAAKYDKLRGSWIWKGTRDKIDWDLLLYNTPNASESIKVVEETNINKCLVLNLTAAASKTGGIIQESDCIASNGFICKMGEARSRCSKTSTTKCCYSPSYDFYIQNRENGYANINLRPSGCQLKIGKDLLECNEVLTEIKKNVSESNHKYSPTRIGSSYYYLANSSDKCIGREAIIQNEDVHLLVTLLFATRENYYSDKNVKIGLTFMLENRMAYWVNGKPDDYYNQYWLPGEPKRDSSVDGGCAAYSDVQGTATYLWRLFPKEMCETFDKICELPLFKASSIYRVEEESKCGKRQERGVLAKTIHSIYSTDEANFGEFPWQVAIMYPEKYGREVQRKFACSGALIHKSFVLTSAHCVTSVNAQKDFLVVLGQHNLNDDSYLLEPIIVDVKEVILHQDFTVRESSLNDLALLQLEDEINVDMHPHIGLGCLPDPEEIRSHGGEWECFITGWSSNERYGRHSKVLKRLEAEFTSEEYCRYINRDYYNLIYKNKRYQSYNKQHYYRSDDPELLCTTSDHDKCLDDQSPLLVCKKATKYVQKPFYDKRQFKDSNFQQPEKYMKSHSKDYVNDDYYSDIYNQEEIIVNAYGENKFDNDKWYIIGIGNTMSECRERQDYLKYDGYKPQFDQGYAKTNKGRPYLKSVYNDVPNDYANENGRLESLYKDKTLSDSKQSYTQGTPVKIITDYNQQNKRDYAKQPFGLNYKHRYEMTEVFTSIYDYISFIYYILDLYQ